MNDSSLIDEIREKIELFIPKLIEFRYSEEKKDEDRQAILLHHKEITNDILKLSEDKQIELLKEIPSTSEIEGFLVGNDDGIMI